MTSRQPRIALLILATAATVAALAWGAVLPATAGGPTSVLLVNPATGAAAALYYTDAAYERLGRAVGTDSAEVGSTAPPDGVDTGGEMRLTWMIHDMTVWRIDRLHRTQEGWWIQTMTPPTGGNPFDGPGRWHRPADEPALGEVLRQAGVLAASQTADESGADDDSTPSGPVVPPANASVSDATPARFVLPGAVGLALGAAGTAALSRRRRTQDADRVTLSG